MPVVPRQAASPLVLDIETSGDAWSGRLLCVGYAFADHGEVRVDRSVSDELAGWLADPSIPTITQGDYDTRWLRLAGYDVQGPLYNLQVMAWTLNETTALDLEELSLLYLGEPMDKRLSRKENRVRFRCDNGKYVDIEDAPYDQLSAYNFRDVDSERRLYLELLDLLRVSGLEDTWRSEAIPFSDLLLEMECAGVPIDLATAKVMSEELNGQADELHARLLSVGDLPECFNLNSNDQLSTFLYFSHFQLRGRIKKGDPVPENFIPAKEGRLWINGHYNLRGRGLELKGNSKTGTDAKTLLVQHGGDEWVKDLLEYKKLTKLCSTYLDAFPRFTHDGRLYGTFRQTGTVTGRLSSSEPNLQNIPSRGEMGSQVRALFKGDLMIGDFGQLEPRLMAHFSGDPVMLDIYRENKDIYKIIAAYIFGVKVEDVTPVQRGICKTLVLALGYGAQEKKIAENLSVSGYYTTPDTAKGYLVELAKLFSVFFEWKDMVVEYAYLKGCVETIGGRRRWVGRSLQSADWKMQSTGERQAVNSIIQGSAADIVAGTMLEIRKDETLTWWLKQLIQVHDELVMECDTDDPSSRQRGLKAVQYHGEIGHGFELAVPLVFEPKYCASWAEK